MPITTDEKETAPSLLYNGQPMRFKPTRVLCLQSHGPLVSDEPEDADIPGLLDDGYSVFVELQPGDGTRYGLLLTSGAGGITVVRIGAWGAGSALLPEGDGSHIAADDCLPLAPRNEWSRVFFAWWLTALLGARPIDAD